MARFSRLIASVAALASAAVLSAPAYAAAVNAGNTNTLCSLSTITGVTSVDACSGFWSGNVLSNTSGDLSIQNTALAAIGYTGTVTNFGSITESIASNGGAATVNFNTALFGTTYIGIHFGSGGLRQFSEVFNGQGGGTVFFRFNAGSNLDTFGLSAPLAQSSSGVALYCTGTANGNSCGGSSNVPVPGTVALFGIGLIGLGLAGFGAVRSRRR